MTKPFLFLDQDGVLADFDKSVNEHNSLKHPSTFKLGVGSYKNLELMDENIPKYLKELSNKYDIYVATKIPHDNPFSAYEKIEWIKAHIPMLQKKVIITPNKGLLGDETSVLVDDRPNKASIDCFKGDLVYFGNDLHNQAVYNTTDWAQLFVFLMDLKKLG